MKKERLNTILVLALPIIGGMVSQNLLNLVDTWFVGQLGNAALGAVGIGGFANFMSQAVILGVSVGVQAVAARRHGEGKHDRKALSLNAALILVLLVAPLLSAALYLVIPHVYHFLVDDPDVMKEGIPYLQIRVLGMTFVGMNFAFRGYWNGISLSKLYMRTLIIMHISNIFLNWVLIFGNLGAPAMGSYGAGLGTTLSTVIGTAVYFWLGFTKAGQHGFMRIKPKWTEITDLIKLSVPNSIQQFFFAAGLTTMFAIIGKIGQDALAAANVLINITLVCILPSIGLGLAAASLVGQALGRKQTEDAAQWGWDVVKVGVVLMILLGLPMWLVPDLILSPFLKDQATLEMARLPMRLVGLTMAGEAVGLILMNAHLGAGDTKTVMVVSIAAQWVVFLPLAYVIGPMLGYGLLGVWILQACYRAMQSVVFCLLWNSGRWKRIKV